MSIYLYLDQPSVICWKSAWFVTIEKVGWKTSFNVLAGFMSSNQLALDVTNTWNFFISRANDQFQMDVLWISKMYLHQQLKTLNLARLHLQVATLSDICTADGTSLSWEIYQGEKQHDRKSQWMWPRQPHLSNGQIKLWQRALKAHFLCTSPPSNGRRSQRTIKCPVGDALDSKPQSNVEILSWHVQRQPSNKGYYNYPT